MNTVARTALFSLFASVSLLASELPLRAQAAPPTSAPEAITLHRPSSGSWDRSLIRHPLVEDALRSYGLRSDRLTRAQERALEDTFSELYPDRDARRQRLNRTQATALVYMALVHPGRRDAALPPGRPVGRACEMPARLVYELEDYFDAPRRGQPRYLRDREQQQLQTSARDIQRQARSCGDFRLTDEATALVRMLAERRVEREQVAQQVDRMKAVVRVAYGR
ncbi:hypothetical protein BH23GEM7_BH23GEM7_23840 [soil metagenome]